MVAVSRLTELVTLNFDDLEGTQANMHTIGNVDVFLINSDEMDLDKLHFTSYRSPNYEQRW